jgi:hypothetical protein
MARRAPGVVTHGTAKQAADVGIGYTASGVSEHSRQIAHSTNIKMHGYVEPAPPQWTRSGPTVAEKIADQEKKLAALHMRLRTERDPERRAKVTSNIEIKTRFIAQLKAEQRRCVAQ